MGKKPALAMYKARKQDFKKGQLYHNSRGSSLLFEARTGILRTKTYRAKFEEVGLLCTACKAETETIKHIVLRCKDLRPARTKGTELDIERVLGFPDEDGRTDEKSVAVMKNRLEDWWKKSRGK